MRLTLQRTSTIREAYAQQWAIPYLRTEIISKPIHFSATYLFRKPITPVHSYLESTAARNTANSEISHHNLITTNLAK